jgi:hypothetical protein
MKKKALALVLALVLVLSLLPMTASAAGNKLLSEFFPTGKLETPRAPYIVYEEDDLYGDYFYNWFNVPHDIMELQKAYGLWYSETGEGYDGFRERFGVEDCRLWLQTDCRVDGGSWQYTSAWDSHEWGPWQEENMPTQLAFDAMIAINLDLAMAYQEDTLSWLTYIEDGNTGFFGSSIVTGKNEYGETIYHFDLANHTFGFRCRVMLCWDDGEMHAICSDWSPETSIGKNGTQRKLTAPTSIAAPTLDNFHFDVDVDEETGYQFTSARYYLNIPDSVFDGLLYCQAQESMYEPYLIEAQLRVNGGDWQDVYTANPDWIFSDERGAAPDTGTLSEKDQVEVRARITCEALGLASEWSNIVGNKPSFIAHSWAEGELAEAAAQGLIPDCLKSADLTKPITRAEFAAVSVKLYESLSGAAAQPASADTFSDTKDPEVLKAFALGVTNGTDAVKKTFEPDTLISREQASTMLTRVWKKLNLSGWTLETDGSFAEEFRTKFAMPDLFADDAEISSWARDSVYFMAANKIVNGVGDNRFAPKTVSSGEETLNFATREQALLMSVRTVKNLG